MAFAFVKILSSISPGPTGDVVGVVEAVGVVSARLRLPRVWTLLVRAGLAEGVGTPLARTVPATRLNHTEEDRLRSSSFVYSG